MIRGWARRRTLATGTGLILLPSVSTGASSSPAQPLDSPMVTIPAGPFIMGNTSEELPEALPRHQVTLSAYSIGAHEVTNAEYRACEASGPCTAPRSLASEPRSSPHTNPAC